ncbi:MAG: hypothetical protein ACFFD6_09990 [Candidatus Thorarchaeota archaeon]
MPDNRDEKELETAHKVVAIMQAITEDLDEPGKRAWRKMLGITSDSRRPSKSSRKENTAKNP